MPGADQHLESLTDQARRLCEARGWSLNQYLGAGATAAVFAVDIPGTKAALKIYSKDFLEGKRGEQVQRRLNLVMDNLRDHDCPTLIRIFDGGTEEDTTFMLMDLAPGSCLGDVLHLVPTDKIRTIISDIAAAAKYLEDRKLCHRDIKSDNIAVSADYSRAILLDLGVIRWLDEESAGTDDDGQLPFVATARYSSPEYMFRLEPSGEKLWRGLTFYQLGGLLHDLIARERLFEEIVRHSENNRYLIAYAVATKTPTIKFDSTIPLDLVVLAQNALEKDLSRRLSLTDWSDFDGNARLSQGEVLLGLRAQRAATPAREARVPALARAIEDGLDKRLTESGVHCRKERRLSSPKKTIFSFSWHPSSPVITENCKVSVEFCIEDKDVEISIEAKAGLTTPDSDTIESQVFPVAGIGQDERDPEILVEQAYEAFIDASSDAVTKHSNRKAVE